MTQLIARGLTGEHMIVSDDHAGLKAARRAVFPLHHSNAASFTCSKIHIPK